MPVHDGFPASYGSCLGNVTWCIDEGFHGDIDLAVCRESLEAISLVRSAGSLVIGAA